ncbi:hypothetical protein BGW39_001457, partial [Mortierella sp. 14UC]
MDRGEAKSNVEEPVVIDIPGESPAEEASAMSRSDNVTEDNVLLLEVSDIQQKNEVLSASKEEKKEIEVDEGQQDDVLPSPQPRCRSYFEVLDSDQIVYELLLRPVKETCSPITFETSFDYLRWTIPTPPRVKKTHYDIVLGISANDLILDAVEAIIITIHHKVQGSSFAKSEVVTSHELRRLCLTEVQSDSGEASLSGGQDSKSSTNATTTPEDLCFRWKLHEKLTDLEEEDPVQMAMEIKTWKRESIYYGSIKLHFAEILTEAQTFYKVDPFYREHRPFIRTVDLNRTGNSQLKAGQEGPMRVTDYTISGDGTHILVAA